MAELTSLAQRRVANLVDEAAADLHRSIEAMLASWREARTEIPNLGGFMDYGDILQLTGEMLAHLDRLSTYFAGYCRTSGVRGSQRLKSMRDGYTRLLAENTRLWYDLIDGPPAD